MKHVKVDCDVREDFYKFVSNITDWPVTHVRSMAKVDLEKSTRDLSYISAIIDGYLFEGVYPRKAKPKRKAPKKTRCRR